MTVLTPRLLRGSCASTPTCCFELDGGQQQTTRLALICRSKRASCDKPLYRRVENYLWLIATGTLGMLAEANSSGVMPSLYENLQAVCEPGIYSPLLRVEARSQREHQRPNW